MATTDVRSRLSNLTYPELVGVLLGLGVLVLGLDLVRLLATGELELSRFVASLWNAVVDSLYIGLAAIGLSLTYSILRFANFAHGDFFTTGAYAGWTVAWLIGGAGVAGFGTRLLLNADGGTSNAEVGITIAATPIAVIAGLLVAAVVTILVALAIDRLVFKRLRDADGITLLIASIGVALAVRYLIALVYTQNSRVVVGSAPEIEGIPVLGSLTYHELTLVGLSVVLIVAVHLMLQYTKLGKSMRAMADNEDLALVTGIPTERVVAATWIIGGGLVGAGGYLYVLDNGQIGINIGWFLLLLIFAGVVLGGIGSIYGALAGSLIVGLTRNLSIIWLPTGLNDVAVFALLILVLIFRPQGLFGGVETT